MKKLTIKFKFDGVDTSTNEISLFERKYHVIFPDYLKAFLLIYGGTRVEENKYLTQYTVSNFLPLLENRNASIEMILPVVRDEEEGVGRNDLIPFATDPGGRPFYVSTGESDKGCVYYDVFGLVADTPVRKIADTFEEFINKLEKE
ncbi:SMI1/KNR4 family protein [Chitinophaga filiformis]|uniref:SMI1 / KNR4 family (SUKH-1) n=1 Tax=Chitinophaga filiformis TaxID=104663 RepID=A0A1G7SUT9_CHIFI|nr:SMI1/KNR4 family protein [Chitinophaga filiformis]SDG26741.1 SMI1 / KNR4 family (SUKH-1) [Chitinophaga filiformis]